MENTTQKPFSGSHTEEIICPGCEEVQIATVEHKFPWNSYVHFCDCGYIVMESEWETVEESKSLI